jgi:hypothetical protein
MEPDRSRISGTGHAICFSPAKEDVMFKKILLCCVALGGLWTTGTAWAGGRPPTGNSAETALLAVIFTPAPVPATGSCTDFKWNRACTGTSQQECTASCGSCSACLDVIQFYPCVYQCSCSC